MQLVFVHGWSVTSTKTYGKLPEVIQEQAPANLGINIKHIFLGKYISFHDEVTVDDIARAFEQARIDVLGRNSIFSCITHSTGAPVIRTWIRKFYGARNKISELPLKHLIMLAPANHGSALAQIGKARAGRIKAWFNGVEPGTGVLNWLELGSTEQRELNLDWLRYRTSSNGFFPFVLTGEKIDEKLYDFVNAYLAEEGSDGVVRVAAANLNYRFVTLEQNTEADTFSVGDGGDEIHVHPLRIRGQIVKPAQRCALEIIPDASHSGKKLGIMNSVNRRNFRNKRVVAAIIESLGVSTSEEYSTLVRQMKKRSVAVQKQNKYSMVMVRVMDDQGNDITDYDLLLLAGEEYHPNLLPKGFFVDRQKNKHNNCQLTYYLDNTVMQDIRDGKLGFRVIPRPSEGFSYYTPAEFRSDDIGVSDLLWDNETLLLDVVLKRHVDVNTFKLDPVGINEGSFKKTKAKGTDVDK